MPRSNSNHKALNIHIAIICALLLSSLPIRQAAHAQYFNKAKQDQPETEAKEKPEAQDSAEQEPSSQETEESSNIGTDSPIVELIKSSQTKKTTMRSKDWNNNKYKKKVAKKKASEEEIKIEAEEKTTEEIEEELTEENKKIWRHYNQLAKRVKEKKEAQEAEQTKETEEEVSGEPQKKDEEKSKDTASSDPGIELILKRYKSTQKKQGPLNSRSFGSID